MPAKEKEISFEEALNELEQIAEKLERGQLTLEDSIKAYERGMELKKICTERLKEAEGKIEYLAKAPDGKIVKESAIKEAKEPKEKKNKEEILF
ncbi:MAG TPA: exodeoxyribonuclease VII small subunit [Leptospiraceae bacterium]|nr:exodeoxyribonuclease VII small subunit [Leptospiraceae bacterium]HMW03627.1 exodeoxyribonuclease VII small subunit [Leptospiraceae bacterium]HMX31246.1 exodeoxyribonuclease VII small subunit [Leptospiraceae bacterium]HMY29452.1 exodeoxyribonuclease VII small subunit [Leptospiraceae bacterium]HMZ64739.1 exodeoxyribonuclease VII small subunit [Leptospiraceae bacterium]